MRATIWSLFPVLFVLCIANGCNQKTPESVSDPTIERTQAPAAESAETPPSNSALQTEKTSGSTASDSTFELAAHWEKSYAAEKKAAFTISLKPRGEYHINQQFPTSVKAQAPNAIALDKTELLKADAAFFSEKQVKFDVPFTPSEAGEHEVNALVNFAVCTAKTCIPIRKNLTVLLKVN